MTPVHCPYCHSEQVVLQEQQSDTFAQFEKFLTLLSPAHMAALGIKLAKDAGIPPYVGGLIGVVVGGTLVLVSQQYFYRHYRSAQHYHCMHCQKDFAVAA